MRFRRLNNLTVVILQGLLGLFCAATRCTSKMSMLSSVSSISVCFKKDNRMGWRRSGPMRRRAYRVYLRPRRARSFWRLGLRADISHVSTSQDSSRINLSSVCSKAVGVLVSACWRSRVEGAWTLLGLGYQEAIEQGSYARA